jgi:CheY-like chemotaxis protein
MVVIEETAPQPTATHGTRHILLVDDDKTFSDATGQLLRRAGFDVTVATDFRVVLEVLEAEGQIDLLISDIVMPSSVNGIALSRMARLRRRDLKVMYLTGYDIPGIENEALGPILRKPIDDARLISEVERLLASA